MSDLSPLSTPKRTLTDGGGEALQQFVLLGRAAQPLSRGSGMSASSSLCNRQAPGKTQAARAW